MGPRLKPVRQRPMADIAGLAGARRCNISHWPLPDGFQPWTHLPDNNSFDVQTCVLSSTPQRHWFSCQPGEYGSCAFPMVSRKPGPGYWPLVPAPLCHNPYSYYVMLMDCLAVLTIVQ